MDTNVKCMYPTETFKGIVRKIYYNGKRVLVARNHSVWEVENQIPNIMIGDIVLCNERTTIQKLENK